MSTRVIRKSYICVTDKYVPLKKICVTEKYVTLKKICVTDKYVRNRYLPTYLSYYLRSTVPGVSGAEDKKT
jgi:hypothetical protein